MIQDDLTFPRRRSLTVSGESFAALMARHAAGELYADRMEAKENGVWKVDFIEYMPAGTAQPRRARTGAAEMFLGLEGFK